MASKDDDEKKREKQEQEERERPSLGTGLAESAAQAIERNKRRKSLTAIDELIGG